MYCTYINIFCVVKVGRCTHPPQSLPSTHWERQTLHPVWRRPGLCINKSQCYRPPAIILYTYIHTYQDLAHTVHTPSTQQCTNPSPLHSHHLPHPRVLAQPHPSNSLLDVWREVPLKEFPHKSSASDLKCTLHTIRCVALHIEGTSVIHVRMWRKGWPYKKL